MAYSREVCAKNSMRERKPGLSYGKTEGAIFRPTKKTTGAIGPEISVIRSGKDSEKENRWSTRRSGILSRKTRKVA